MSDIFRGVWVVAYRELLRFIQERSRLFSSFAMPLIFLVIFGAGFGETIGAMVPGVNYLQFMYPGIIAMTVVMGAIMSGISVVWDREFGFLKRFWSLLWVEAALCSENRSCGNYFCYSGYGYVDTGSDSKYLFKYLMILQLLLVVFIISVSISGLGLLVAAHEIPAGFQLVTQIIIMPLIFSRGVFPGEQCSALDGVHFQD